MLESVRIKSESKVMNFFLIFYSSFIVLLNALLHLCIVDRRLIYIGHHGQLLNLGPKSCADSVNYRSQIKLARSMDPT